MQICWDSRKFNIQLCGYKWSSVGVNAGHAHSITGVALIVPHAYHGFSLTPNKHAGVFKRKHTHFQWLPAATTYLPAPIHPHPSLHFPSVTDSPPNNPANPHSQTHTNIEGKGHPWWNLSSITMAHVHNQAWGLTQIVPAVMPLSHRWRERGRFVYLK